MTEEGNTRKGKEKEWTERKERQKQKVKKKEGIEKRIFWIKRFGVNNQCGGFPRAIVYTFQVVVVVFFFI